MVELTRLQMETLERLFEAGFRPIAIAPYENALCVHRGEYAAVLAPVENGGLRLLAPATLMLDGNLSVKLKRGEGEVFVWKQKRVVATQERLNELEKFRTELAAALERRKLERADHIVAGNTTKRRPFSRGKGGEGAKRFGFDRKNPSGRKVGGTAHPQVAGAER